MDGIITFNSSAENTISITFDDQKTDEGKIVSALIKGGVAIPGKPAPEPESTISYK
jgi:hypothetical protein